MRKKIRSKLILLMLLYLITTLFTPINTGIASEISVDSFSGAIWTTDKTGTEVNKNHYDLREDVYLNGGPQGSSPSMQDGEYWVKVESPGRSEPLGKSNEAVIKVENGKFKELYRLWDIVYSASSNFTRKGFDFTDNSGDNYRVVVSTSEDFHSSQSKSDNFQVSDRPNPSIGLTKTVSPQTAKQGNEVSYTFTVTNTGNVDLSDVVIEDSILEGGLDFEIGDLLAGAVSGPITRSYTIPEDAEFPLINTATASGWYNGQKVQDISSATVSSDNDSPAILLEKTADPVSAKAGDTITYTFKVTNTGNVALTDVKVTDPLLEVDWVYDTGALAAGESVTFTADYTIPEDAEFPLVNEATASGWYNGQKFEAKATAEVSLLAEPSIKIKKTASMTKAKPGYIPAYYITVTNTGNVPLTDVEVIDPMFGSDERFNIGNLAVGEEKRINLNYTIPYDAKFPLVNTAEVSGFYMEYKVEDEDTAVIELKGEPGPGAAIQIIKHTDDCDAFAGDTIEYCFTVENVGLVGLTDVVVTDPLFGEEWNYVIGDLQIEEHVVFWKCYDIPEDFEGDVLTNTAYVSGKYVSEDDDYYVEDSDTVKVSVLKPAIDLEKSVNPTQARHGETVTYTFKVTNVGNVPLCVVLFDPLFGEEWYERIGYLEPGYSEIIEKTYEIPSEKSFPFTNTAKAVGFYGFYDEQPEAYSLNGGYYHDGMSYVTDEDSATVSLRQIYNPPVVSGNPSIKIDKDVSDSEAQPGETVTYTFTVTNTGDTYLYNVNIKDPLFGDSWIHNIGILAQGASVKYEQTYTIPEDAEFPLVNVATAWGVYNAITVQDTDDATIEREEIIPSLHIEKLSSVTEAKAGDTITYTFKVTNTGNVDLTDVKVTDPLLEDGWVHDIGALAAGESVTFTADYTIPEDAEFPLVNTATALGFWGELEFKATDDIAVAEKEEPVVEEPDEEEPPTEDLPKTGGPIQPEAVTGTIGFLMTAVGVYIRKRNRR